MGARVRITLIPSRGIILVHRDNSKPSTTIENIWVFRRGVLFANYEYLFRDYVIAIVVLGKSPPPGQLDILMPRYVLKAGRSFDCPDILRKIL